MIFIGLEPLSGQFIDRDLHWLARAFPSSVNTGSF